MTSEVESSEIHREVPSSYSRGTFMCTFHGFHSFASGLCNKLKLYDLVTSYEDEDNSCHVIGEECSKVQRHASLIVLNQLN